MSNFDLLSKVATDISNIKINVTEKNLLDKFDDHKRWPMFYPWGQPSVEIILNDGSKSQDFFAQDGFIIPEKIKNYYDDGYTLIISNINELFDDFKKVSDALTNGFGEKFNINAYFGKGAKTVSFKTHAHDYPVLVKNVFGRSDWIIKGENVSLDGHDVLFFDAFTDHEVVKIHDTKLSLTCNLEGCRFNIPKPS